MRKTLRPVVLLVCGLLLAATFVVVRGSGQAPAERYLHVRVESGQGETVRVNLPLSVAEKVLPTIDHGALHHGRVKIGHADLEGIDVRALLDAVRTASDNEFVTVRNRDCNVRVAKSGGLLLIDVQDKEAPKNSAKSTVKVKVPMRVVEALFSADHDELDLVAAVHALQNVDDTILVSVEDGTDTVRVWVDSHNTGE